MNNKMIRVAVVDDSALMREILSSILSEAPDIQVIGTARDPYVARELIKKTNPDVLTLDIEMPRMDGLGFLEKIMTLRPMPVVMVSSLTQKGADATMQALELGAVDFVSKPAFDLQSGMKSKSEEIIAKVRTASLARVRGRQSNRGGVQPQKPAIRFSSTEKIIAIGASTGGVEALREIICQLPPDAPAVLVTQHMPEQFTKSFATRLDSISRVKVQEATDGQRVLPGHVYLAPGHSHMALARTGANYLCKVFDGPPVSGHRPSVDVLFESMAQVAGMNGVGVILTGMGRDGAAGLVAMRKAGARTIGQDEASCVVYGMPRAAFDAGGVEKQMSLSSIGAGLVEAAGAGADKVRAVRV
ncbi:MAG: chemotaxis response regulator protein-glutamate methylesterase [Minwuia sp.]|nr:chemotaxis response regulator protein-glutamate methylesterase [Minwuia sp.]